MERDYTLVRSRKRKKTISLVVNREGRVIVRAPYGVLLSEIEDFIARKGSWLERKLAEFNGCPDNTGMTSGMAKRDVLYLGEGYPLHFEQGSHDGEEMLRWTGSAFYLARCEASIEKALLARWYISQAATIFPGRVAHFSRIMGVSASRVRISSARSRFGSCSGQKCVSLSWRLIMAPLAVIDFVIIHELAHLVEMNHSPRFWSCVQKFCPDYEHHKAWLRKNFKMFMQF